MSFPEALKRFRKAYNLTQKEAALHLGISERVYQAYEYGKVRPGIDSIIALADHFNISLDYLCGRSDDPTRH